MNEIETRGMSEVGIYRVPGADRSVKDLKERFLRGKGTPNLVSLQHNTIRQSTYEQLTLQELSKGSMVLARILETGYP